MTPIAITPGEKGDESLPCRASYLFTSAVFCALASLALYPGGLVISENRGEPFGISIACAAVFTAGAIYNSYVNCLKRKDNPLNKNFLEKKVVGKAKDPSSLPPAGPSRA